MRLDDYLESKLPNLGNIFKKHVFNPIDVWVNKHPKLVGITFIMVVIVPQVLGATFYAFAIVISILAGILGVM